MSARAELRRKLGLLATAFATGLVLILIGVSILDSRAFVGGTLFTMFLVVAFGYHWFRCPSCKHSILHYTVKEMRAWMSGGPRFCPFCESDFEPAARASSLLAE